MNDFIHHFIAAAGGNVANAPTLRLRHGTGADENDLLDLGKTLAPETNLIRPRGKISENPPIWQAPGSSSPAA
jgi:phospholipase/carboxylesterase